jgi:hypothetical protein
MGKILSASSWLAGFEAFWIGSFSDSLVCLCASARRALQGQRSSILGKDEHWLRDIGWSAGKE